MPLPEYLTPLIAFGALAIVFLLAGLYVRFRRGLVTATAVVEQGAGPLGILTVRWGGSANRTHRASTFYVGRWIGAGERVPIRYAERAPARIEIVGLRTRGIPLFVLAGLSAVGAVGGSLAIALGA